MIKELILHADNCAGQNKNKLMLMYRACRAKVWFNDYVKLCVMVAGHTKDVVHGSFDHVKPRLNESDTIQPRDMMGVVCKRSSANLCVPSADVLYQLWKPFFER